ncbi:MAG: inner membrane protein YpjD [Gammaproteobacteria bacterium]
MLSVSIVAKWVHILLATVVFIVLCLAALQAIFLAVQEKQLHHKQLTGIIQKLPPLQTMEAWLFRLISIGFILLSGLLLSSTLFFHMTPQLLQKTIISSIAWGVFAGLLAGRHWWGWRGKCAIWATIGGVILLIMIYFGSLVLFM